MSVLSGSSYYLFVLSNSVLLCIVVCTESCYSASSDDSYGWFSTGKRYEFDYSLSVQLQLSDTAKTADKGGDERGGSVPLTCRVSVDTGHWGSCVHRLKFQYCSVQQETGVDESWRDSAITSLLSSNTVYYQQTADGVSRLMLQSAEPDDVTNIRRSLVKLLTVDKRLFLHPAEPAGDTRCRPVVFHVEDDLYQLSKSLQCDLEEVSVPASSSRVSNYFWRWLLRSTGSDAVHRCDYLVSDSGLRHVTCGHSIPLQILEHRLLTIVSRQELVLAETANTTTHTESTESDPVSDTVSAAVAMTTGSLSPIRFSHPVSSVADCVHSLLSISPQDIDVATIGYFDALLSALRVSFEPPFDYVDGCEHNCSQVQKEFTSNLVTAALLLCDTAPCDRYLPTLTGNSRISRYQLLPIVFSWLWNPALSADGISARLSICSAAEFSWCPLYIFTNSLIERYQTLKTMQIDVSVFEQLFQQLRERILADLGEECNGQTDRILLAIKLLSQVGDELFHDRAVTLLSQCLTAVDRDGHQRAPLVVSEAVNAVMLIHVEQEQQMELLFKRVVSDPAQHEMSRQIAFLHYIQLVADTNSSYSPSIQMALQSIHTPFSRFAVGYFLSLPAEHTARALIEQALLSRGISPISVQYNLSVIQSWNVEVWPSYTLHIDMWTLHSEHRKGVEKFLPHVFRLSIALKHNASNTYNTNYIANISDSGMVGVGEDIVLGPLQLEVRATRLLPVLKRLLRSMGDRSMLQRVVMTILRHLLSNSLVDQLLNTEAAEKLSQLLQPLTAVVDSWFQPEFMSRLMTTHDNDDGNDDGSSGMLSVRLGDRQLVYIASCQLAALMSQLSSQVTLFDEWPLFGLVVSRWHAALKPLHLNVDTVLPVGLPLHLSADLTSIIGSMLRVNSTLVKSPRNLTENLGGDASLNLTSALSLVVNARVYIPTSRDASASLYVSDSSVTSAVVGWNISAHSAISLGLSYLQRGRVFSVNVNRPGNKARLFHRMSYQRYVGIDGSTGSSNVKPTSSQCFANAAVLHYLALRVCHSWGVSVPPIESHVAVYEIEVQNTESVAPWYTVQLWTSRRADGYQHGASYHVRFLAPGAGAPGVHFTVSIRLRPINYNPHLFELGHHENTTVELLVGSVTSPVLRVYGRHASRQEGDAVLSETLLDVTKQSDVILQLHSLGNKTVWTDRLSEWQNNLNVFCSISGYGDWRAVQKLHTSRDLIRVRFSVALTRPTQEGLVRSSRNSDLSAPALFLLKLTIDCDEPNHVGKTVCSSHLALSAPSYYVITTSLHTITWKQSHPFNSSFLFSVGRSLSDNWFYTSWNTSSSAVVENNYRMVTQAVVTSPLFSTTITGVSIYRMIAEPALALESGVQCFRPVLKQIDSEWHIGRHNETIVTLSFDRWRAGDISGSVESRVGDRSVFERDLYHEQSPHFIAVRVSLESPHLTTSFSYKNAEWSSKTFGKPAVTKVALILDNAAFSSNLSVKFGSSENNSVQSFQSMTANFLTKDACCLPSVDFNLASSGGVSLKLILPTASDSWLIDVQFSKSTATTPVIYSLWLDTRSDRGRSGSVSVKLKDDPDVPGQVVANVRGSPNALTSASLGYLQTLFQKYSDDISRCRRRLADLTSGLLDSNSVLNQLSQRLRKQTGDGLEYLVSVISPLFSAPSQLWSYISETISTVSSDNKGLWSSVWRYASDSLWSVYSQLAFRVYREQDGASTLVRFSRLPNYFSLQNVSASVNKYISDLVSSLSLPALARVPSRHTASIQWSQYSAMSLAQRNISLSGDASCAQLLFYHRHSGILLLLFDRYVLFLSPDCTALLSFCHGLVSLRCKNQNQRYVSVHGDEVLFDFDGFSSTFYLSTSTIDLSVERWLSETAIGTLVDTGSVNTASLTELASSVALDSGDINTCRQRRVPSVKHQPRCTELAGFARFSTPNQWNLVDTYEGQTAAHDSSTGPLPILRVNLAFMDSGIGGVVSSKLKLFLDRFLAKLRRLMTQLDSRNVQVSVATANHDGNMAASLISLEHSGNISDADFGSVPAHQLLQLVQRQVACSTAPSNSVRTVFVVMGQSQEMLTVSQQLAALSEIPHWSLHVVSSAVDMNQTGVCPNFIDSMTAMAVFEWLARSSSGAVWNCSQSCDADTIGDMVDLIWRWSLHRRPNPSLIPTLLFPDHNDYGDSRVCTGKYRSSAEPLISTANSPLSSPHCYHVQLLVSLLLLLLTSLFSAY